MLGAITRDEPEFSARIQESLRQAEKRIQEGAVDDPRIAGLTGHLAAAGGKRMRPLLVLLGGEFGDPRRPGVVDAAVIAELVHVSSLYHDDVMDAAATRHGVPSANVLWGNKTAVRGGNWLLARSAQLGAALAPEAFRLNARTSGRIVMGQARELSGPLPGEDPLDYYEQVTAGKTSALLSMALGIGALQAGASDARVEVLLTFGEHLGIAFQIADDLLDLVAPESSTGKERGKDLKAGVSSLPVLLARADTDPSGAELRALLKDGPVTDPAALHRSIDLLRTAPALARTRAQLSGRIARARDTLDVLPERPARRALYGMCDFVASRGGCDRERTEELS